MIAILALAAALASPQHIIDKAFGVTLGKPAGDLSKRGFRPNEYASNSWVRTDDAFFDRVTVSVNSILPIVDSISGSKRYEDGDRQQREDKCKADLATVAATIRAKYPSLRKAFWLKNEDGRSGMLGYYRKEVFDEPAPQNADPSPARHISLTCDGPSIIAKGDEANRPTSLYVIYYISEQEREPINRAFRAQEQQRERDRAKAIGVDANKL